MPTDSAQKIRIGTRASKLALTQADEIKNLLLAKTDLKEHQIEIVKITTSGDKIQDISLADIGGKGLFIKELEEQLIAKKIDIAVHSAKDVPPILHEKTELAAFTTRKDARDYFISKKYNSIKELPQGAVIGTSSARRKASLLRLRPDLKITNFRGNVDTRLRKIEEEQVDASILAICGLQRLQKEIIDTNIIPITQILPAVGQGALTIQILSENTTAHQILRKINDEKSEICIKIEREFLRLLNASCKSPVAVYCRFADDDNLQLQTIIFDFDGKEIFATNITDNVKNAHKIAKQAASETKQKAGGLLSKICQG